jgi:hypothetical protein
MTTALTTIEAAKKKNALICLNEGDFLSTEPLFKPQVTLIELELPGEKETESADCWNIQGKIVPKRHTIDRMGEASGISFVAEQSKNRVEMRDDPVGGKRQVFVSEQQGKMRMPDGSWKTSSLQSYEFDPVLRALEDQKLNTIGDHPLSYQSDKPGRNGSSYKGKSTGQLILENNKRGRQMAETGARLRVVKEMTAMPTALSRAQASKPLTFGRWVQNTDYLLSTPEGRLLAAAQATGTQELVAALYGKQALPDLTGGQSPEPRNVTEENAGDGRSPDAQSAERLAEEAGDDWSDLKRENAGDGFQELSITLEQYLATYRDQLDVDLKGKNGIVNPYKLARAEFENPAATVETRRIMIDRINKLLKNMEAS